MIGCTSATQTLLPTGDAGVFGSFSVSEERLVGDFIGALAANDAQLLADFVSAAGLYSSSLPVVTGLLTGDVSSPVTQSIFSDLYRSDHVGFWLEGYDALLLTDTANFRNPNYHQASDTSSILDYPFMTQVVAGSVGFFADRAGLVTVVPGPGASLLLATGLLILVVAQQRRAQQRGSPATSSIRRSAPASSSPRNSHARGGSCSRLRGRPWLSRAFRPDSPGRAVVEAGSSSGRVRSKRLSGGNRIADGADHR